MAKKRLGTGYTFDASAQTIVHADFSDITLAGIQLIVNVTDQIIIYNFADTAKGGTLATDTLALEYDTTTMSDTDELMILVEDGVAAQPVSAASLPLPSGASTSANQTTIIGHLDGVEGLLTTIDSDTGTIATEVAGLLTDTELRATPVPVSGTVTANLAAGTNNIGDVDILSIAAGDNNIGNVDIVSSALPAGASTLAEQQSQTTHLATIAGDTTNIETAVQLIDDMVVAQGTALGTTKLSLNGASVTTAAPTYTTGQISPLNLATTGALRVDVGATSANATAIKVNVASGGIASGAIASGAIASGAIASGAIAAGATSIATTEDTASAAGDHLVKVAQIRLDTPVSGANTSGSGDYTQFIADSFGKTWTAGTYPEDLAHVAGEPIKGNGTRRIDTAATSAGSSGDWATLDSSAEGAQWVTTTPTTTSGCTIFRSIDLDETEEEIKATAGNLYGYYFFNSAATTHYLKFYNLTAANTTVGTSTPVLTFPLPAGAAGHISFGFPVSFSTAISAAVTTGLADNDTGAPAASAVILNAFYK